MQPSRTEENTPEIMVTPGGIWRDGFEKLLLIVTLISYC
jgi:hypothetical protein